MKRFMFIFSGLLIVTGCLFSSTWQGTNSLKLAVLDFNLIVTNENIDPKIITELFQSELVNQKKFIIVERRQLEKVLSEKKLELSGLTESEQASRVGAMMGAQKIVTGTISRMGTKYILIVKGIDTSTGAVDVSDQLMVNSIDRLLAFTAPLAARFTKKALGEKTDDGVIGDSPSVESPQAESVQEREDIEFKLDTLLERKAYRDKKIIPEFQSLSKNLTKNEKIFYYAKYENKALGYTLLNILPFGVGSWVQGDMVGGGIVAGGMITGIVIANNSKENTEISRLAGYVELAAYLYGYVAPWIFSWTMNSRLKDALLYDNRSAGLVRPDLFAARNVELFQVNLARIQF